MHNKSENYHDSLQIIIVASFSGEIDDTGEATIIEGRREMSSKDIDAALAVIAKSSLDERAQMKNALLHPHAHSKAKDIKGNRTVILSDRTYVVIILHCVYKHHAISIMGYRGHKPTYSSP